MAEGLARHFYGEMFTVQSAGSEPGQLDPLAVQAMADLGIDISHHFSKSVDDIEAGSVDIVITLCKKEVCPVFLVKTEKLNWPHEDPVNKNLSKAEQLQNFCKVRDQIQKKLQQLVKELAS